MEQRFLRVAVAPVLLYGIENRLLGEGVLEFESGDKQAVDKYGHIQGERGIRAAVAQLAGDAENIGGENVPLPSRCLASACRRKTPHRPGRA